MRIETFFIITLFVLLSSIAVYGQYYDGRMTWYGDYAGKNAGLNVTVYDPMGGEDDKGSVTVIENGVPQPAIDCGENAQSARDCQNALEDAANNNSNSEDSNTGDSNDSDSNNSNTSTQSTDTESEWSKFYPGYLKAIRKYPGYSVFVLLPKGSFQPVKDEKAHLVKILSQIRKRRKK